MNKRALPKYVKFEARGARRYFYFRRRGHARVTLPDLPYSPQFMEAYHAAVAGTALAVGTGRSIPGTVSAAIMAFYKYYGFTKNREITRQTDRNILEAFRTITATSVSH